MIIFIPPCKYQVLKCLKMYVSWTMKPFKIKQVLHQWSLVHQVCCSVPSFNTFMWKWKLTFFCVPIINSFNAWIPKVLLSDAGMRSDFVTYAASPRCSKLCFSKEAWHCLSNTGLICMLLLQHWLIGCSYSYAVFGKFLIFQYCLYFHTSAYCFHWYVISKSSPVLY